MKKYIILLLLCLALTNSAFSQITLSWPINRAVYQRDNSGSATIIIAGQAPPVAWVSTWELQYQIETLYENGSVNYVSTSWTNITTPGLGKVFRVSRTQPTGWYQLTVRIIDNGTTLIGSNTIKFGVGEVFIIAGQSNAAGEGSPNYSTSANSGQNYDCIISSAQPNKCSGTLPLYPTFGALSKTTGYITPNGFDPWAYNMLATKIIAASGVVPVMFFNTGLSGTSSDDWRISADDPTADRSNNNTLARCSQNGAGYGQGEPFRSLRNALNYYGSLFGVRGVIWHQGEADNGYSYTGGATYTSNLNEVIQKSRDYFSANLPWAISSVSYNSSSTDATVTGGQSSSRSAKSATNGTASDTYINGGSTTYRQTVDNVHFEIEGLAAISTDYKNDFASNLSAKTPIQANPIVPVTFTQVGSTKVVTLDFASIGQSSSNFNCFFWTQSDDYTAITYPSYGCSSSDTDTKTFSTNGQWRCYMRENTTGNVYMTQRLTINTDANVRLASNAETLNSVVYPNPTYEGFENTIKFDVTEQALVKLELVNEQGKVLKTLADGLHDLGKYEYPFTLKSKGLMDIRTIYYRLTVGDKTETKRIILQ